MDDVSKQGYKRYLIDPDIIIPRTTAWRKKGERRQVATNEDEGRKGMIYM